MKGGVEEVPRAVPREHAPRSVRSVRPGSQTYNDQTRTWIAEAWDRLSPVVRALETSHLHARDLLAPADEAGASAAAGDLVRQGGEGERVSRRHVRGVSSRRLPVDANRQTTKRLFLKSLEAASAPGALLIAGHAALAYALAFSRGHFDGDALVLVVAAVVAWGVALGRLARGAATPVHIAQRAAWLAGMWSLSEALWRPPGIYLRFGPDGYRAFAGCAAAVLATYGLDVFGLATLPRRLAIVRRVLLFALAFAMGSWLLRASPDPKIDIFPLHQQAAEALLSGKPIYEPGVIQTLETYQNRLPVDAYTYLPFGACLTTIAYALTHESRWAELIGQLTGALLLWIAARPSAHIHPHGAPRARVWGDLLAALLLFHPRGFFVLEQAWTEPLILPFLGGVVVLAQRRRPVAASVCLGLLCALKQHMILYLPFFALLPGIGFGGVVLAGLVALVTILPFVLQTPYGFYRGILGLHANGPFRADALAIPAYIFLRTGRIVPTWVGFLAALGPVALLARIRRELSTLLLGSCLAFGLFYVLGRQAFCNYYYLLDATALFAAATLAMREAWSGREEERGEEPEEGEPREERPHGEGGDLDDLVVVGPQVNLRHQHHDREEPREADLSRTRHAEDERHRPRQVLRREHLRRQPERGDAGEEREGEAIAALDLAGGVGRAREADGEEREGGERHRRRDARQEPRGGTGEVERAEGERRRGDGAARDLPGAEEDGVGGLDLKPALPVVVEDVEDGARREEHRREADPRGDAEA